VKIYLSIKNVPELAGLTPAQRRGVLVASHRLMQEPSFHGFRFAEVGFVGLIILAEKKRGRFLVLTTSSACDKLAAMSRKLRIQYGGAIYHVMNRGDHQEAIFRSRQDRQLFLKTLGQACAKTDWQVHAWCLMSNHFHLVVETPKPNLVDGMKWLLGTYTARFNRRHKLFGHLFSGRYKALFVDGSGNGYLKTACDYVHLNPVRARLLSGRQKLSEFSWSSYPEYLKASGARPNWLRVDRLLGEHGILKDSAAGRTP
jgi:REP element-mobilizing transposase RayT